MRFIWDTTKAVKNERKHGIDFPTASRVFFDPHRYEERDASHSEREDRWRTVGITDAKILFVVFTERNGDIIRIISARKADKDEQRKYYNLFPRP